MTPLRRAIWFMLAAALAGCKADKPPLPRLAADATVLAFGDSLTYGTGAAREQSYPAVLAELTGREVVNAGMPGEVSAAGLARLPELLDEYSPQLLILCHGGNDMLRRSDLAAAAGNLREMIALARERGIEVVLLGVPKPGLFLNAAEFYGEVAASTGVPYEPEALPEILADAALKSDPIHPNAKGYRRLAEAVYALLQEAGAL